MRLTDEEWEIISVFFRERPNKTKVGRPRKSSRDVFDGILWVLRTGSQWRELPSCFPPYQTCHRWFQKWQQNGSIHKAVSRLSYRLHKAGLIDLSESFIDGSFSSAKRGGDKIGKTKKGKGTKIMAIVDKNGLPLSLTVESASPHEITLVEECIKSKWLKNKLTFLVGDKAYDSDSLDSRLNKKGITLIAPHKSNRKKPNTQDGRLLRRYKRRWKVECLFAWLHNFRRLICRFEIKSENFLAMIQISCLLILLRRFVLSLQ